MPTLMWAHRDRTLKLEEITSQKKKKQKERIHMGAVLKKIQIRGRRVDTVGQVPKKIHQ